MTHDIHTTWAVRLVAPATLATVVFSLLLLIWQMAADASFVQENRRLIGEQNQRLEHLQKRLDELEEHHRQGVRP